MSLATALYTLLNSSAGLNALVDGIYYQIVPDNAPPTEKNIVYTFLLYDSIDTIQANNVLDWYDLKIAILVQDTADADAIITQVRTLLDNYTNTNFRYINYENSNMVLDGEREQFVTELSYRILFNN